MIFPHTSAGRRGSAWRGIVVLLAVFGAGFVGGAATERYLVDHSGLFPLIRLEPRDGARREPTNVEGWRGRTERREELPRDPNDRRGAETGIPPQMFRLNLTPQQEHKLVEIARRRRPAAESLMASLRPAVRNIENQMMQEMLCALTPAQQAHWLAYMDTARFDPAIVAERYRPVRTGTCEATRR